MKMQWDVLCANPIIPADWSQSYKTFFPFGVDAQDR